VNERSARDCSAAVTAAVNCGIASLKCIEFDFRGDSETDPAGGTYSYIAPPAPLAVFKRSTSKRSEGKGERNRMGEEGKGKGREKERTGGERKKGSE